MQFTTYIDEGHRPIDEDIVRFFQHNSEGKQLVRVGTTDTALPEELKKSYPELLVDKIVWGDNPILDDHHIKPFIKPSEIIMFLNKRHTVNPAYDTHKLNPYHREKGNCNFKIMHNGEETLRVNSCGGSSGLHGYNLLHLWFEEDKRNILDRGLKYEFIPLDDKFKIKEGVFLEK